MEDLIKRIGDMTEDQAKVILSYLSTYCRGNVEYAIQAYNDTYDDQI